MKKVFAVTFLLLSFASAAFADGSGLPPVKGGIVSLLDGSGLPPVKSVATITLADGSGLPPVKALQVSDGL